jgi:hypothetical protein
VLNQIHTKSSASSQDTNQKISEPFEHPKSLRLSSFGKYISPHHIKIQTLDTFVTIIDSWVSNY